MDREKWMYGCKRASAEYINGVGEFLEMALKEMGKQGKKKMLCPCVDCDNCKYKTSDEVKSHLIRRGFKRNYTNWVWHGEAYVPEEEVGSSHVPGSGLNDRVNVNCDLNEFFENNLDNQFVDNNCESGENVDDVPFVMENNELDEMMCDVEAGFVDIPDMFANMSADNKKPLFPNCTKYTKLTAIFKLFNLKAKNGWSDKSFTDLLGLVRDMLPDNNELPETAYEARKMLCPLRMEAERIHACPKDCMLYRKESSTLDKCRKCERSRYKPSHDQKEEKKRPAAKTVFYLPIIPRIKRLFANPRDAELLRWHEEGRKKDGKLRHPADSPQWRNINREFPDFASETRNLRFGLCTDGMSPFGTFSSQKTTWPVMLCVYNLPPWLCMKRKYLMMPLLISGPKQPGNDIDVYLAPLIEELKVLWEEGVEVWDAYKQEKCIIRGMIYCTVNDYPAYGNLSGHKVKGEKACPICGSDTCSIRLAKCHKNVYLSHRRHLRRDHPYRRMKKRFNGRREDRPAPIPLNGKEVLAQVENIVCVFGKEDKSKVGDKEEEWKKKSIFWNLPYWQHLDVRHCLDVMHIVKNVLELLLGFFNVYGKPKDCAAAREDMISMGIRQDLAPQPNPSGTRTYLPPAKYTLSKAEKTSVLQCLKSIKVPSGYSSNISSKVSMKDLKVIGLKSHDCHVLMTQLLPVAIRGVLPEDVRHTITKLCFFFNAICSKVVDPESLHKLQRDLVETICELEMYFPPSFFDIMVHLTVHLVREVQLCGPVFLRWMYPFERAMGNLKRMVRSRSRPEGSIVEGFVDEEAIEFVSDYLEGVQAVGIPRSRHEGRLQGVGTLSFKKAKPGYAMRQKAHLKVLQHLAVVAPFISKHLDELRLANPRKPESWINQEHDSTFSLWFERRIRGETTANVGELVKFLGNGPDATVYTYQGYDMNGFTWYTRTQDSKSTSQNSGVTVDAISVENVKTPFYGWIEEIWELDYHVMRIPIFKCKWIMNEKGGVYKEAKSGFTIVDQKKTGYDHDPFILASQAKQVFYIEDPACKGRHVVLPGKRHIVGVDNVVSEEDYDYADEQPPFSSGVESSPIEENADGDVPCVRVDHEEGIWEKTPVKKKKKRKSKK